MRVDKRRRRGIESGRKEKERKEGESKRPREREREGKRGWIVRMWASVVISDSSCDSTAYRGVRTVCLYVQFKPMHWR
jgi:hypothetical protein